MMAAPQGKEELIIYLAAAKEAISPVPMNDRCYQTQRLQKDGQGAYNLEEYDIQYRPRTSVKGQILVDFIVERPEDNLEDTLMEDAEELQDPWTLFTDGSSCADGSGAGLILTNLEGMEFTYALRFRFDATNNEAEYEALIAGLKIAEQMGVENLQENAQDSPWERLTIGETANHARCKKVFKHAKTTRSPPVQGTLKIVKRQSHLRDHHNLWDIIVNGDLQEEAAPAGELPGLPTPKTAKQLTTKRNQERVKSIFLLAIPDEYLLKFHNVPDAKSLWAAIKSRFRGNDESKKIQRNVLKHQFENFTTAPHESLDKAYDRVYEDEMKRSSRSTSKSQNLAFLSSENTSSTNEVSTTSGDFRVSTAGGTSSSSQHIYEDDLEESDLRWQVAMLTVRVKKFIQKTGRNLDFKGKQPVGFDKSKIECYNCYSTRKGTLLRNGKYRVGTKGKGS
ncbi:reverse transcriptase domain-containing protein [Tanacetum coccineum]